MLDRAIAERGRFPAVNVLKSVSRAMPQCNSDSEQSLVLRARAPMTLYEDMAELVRVGATANDVTMWALSSSSNLVVEAVIGCSSLLAGPAVG